MQTGSTSNAFQQAASEFERIEALQDGGQYDQALDASRALIKKQPKWPYGHYALGVSLFLLGQFEDSRRALRKAIALKDGVALFHAKLGEALHRLDDTDAAMDAMDRAIGLEPSNTDFPVTKAWLLRLSGRNDESFEILNTLYERGERGHRLTRILAGLLGQAGEPQRGIGILLPVAQDLDPNPKINAADWYVLAKLYDQSEQYSEAYAAATRGAELNAKPYEPEAREAIMEDRLGSWTEDSMPKLARSRSSSETPVFIVGMPRSGTTLVEQIIAAHPEAYGAGELINIFTAAHELVTPRDASQRMPEMVEQLKPATLNRTARRILRDMEKQAPSGSKPRRITDKLLLNFQHLGLIEQLFPHARVIVCSRNPLDNFISSYLLDFEGHNAHAYTDRPEWFAHFYALHRRYIEHYTRVCSLPILEVRYEDIVEDQRGQTERLLAFIGLPFDEACMRFHEHERAVVTASSDQVRQRIYRRAVGRHEHYAEHLGPARAALRAQGIEIG